MLTILCYECLYSNDPETSLGLATDHLVLSLPYLLLEIDWLVNHRRVREMSRLILSVVTDAEGKPRRIIVLMLFDPGMLELETIARMIEHEVEKSGLHQTTSFEYLY